MNIPNKKNFFLNFEFFSKKLQLAWLLKIGKKNFSHLKGASDDVCIANKAYTETCFGHDSVKITSFPVKNGHRFPLYLSFYSYTKHSDIYFPNYKKVR